MCRQGFPLEEEWFVFKAEQVSMRALVQILLVFKYLLFRAKYVLERLKLLWCEQLPTISEVRTSAS